MKRRLPYKRIIIGLALLLLNSTSKTAQGQVDEGRPLQTVSRVASLGLSAAKVSRLQGMVRAHDYIAAEKLLLAEIATNPPPARKARLLNFIGAIYFLNYDDLNAAIAWTKSEAIAPLDPQVRFSLAMAYIRIGHSDWAMGVLKSLAAQYDTQPIYVYWLGRLNYDGHLYDDAILNFKDAIRLDPDMARAYDSLGLCYYFLNQNAKAIENYKKAIELGYKSHHPNAWPYLDLAATLAFLNQNAEAEEDLRTAIQLDPKIPSAHFRLGNILERRGQIKAAISQFQEAAHLDPNYAEPHFALGRLYRRLGDNADSRKEIREYMRIHAGTPSTVRPQQ